MDMGVAWVCSWRMIDLEGEYIKLYKDLYYDSQLILYRGQTCVHKIDSAVYGSTDSGIV